MAKRPKRPQKSPAKKRTKSAGAEPARAAPALSKALAVRELDETAIAIEREELEEREAEFADARFAENTKRAYANAWRAFCAWCKARRRPYLPATPETLAAYLTWRASREEPDAVSTLAVALYAIAEAHRVFGKPSPHKDPRVVDCWKGIRRKLGVAPRRPRAPALRELVREMIDALDGADNREKAIRDAAILTLGFAGAFRRSELVALRIEDLERTDSGYLVRLRRSKTDQEGRGDVVAIPSTSPPCAVVCLDRWLDRFSPVRGPGPLFVKIDRWGNYGEEAITARVIHQIVCDAIAATGRDPKAFGAHSLRAGLATSAASAGKSIFAIKKQGRWRSIATVDRYVRQANPFDDNASELE